MRLFRDNMVKWQTFLEHCLPIFEKQSVEEPSLVFVFNILELSM